MTVASKEPAETPCISVITIGIFRRVGGSAASKPEPMAPCA